MRLEGAAAGLPAQLRKQLAFDSSTRAEAQMCDTLHLPARLVPRRRKTSRQPPSFRQRIAAAQERDRWLSHSLPNDSPMFAKTRCC
jgi:hypothetical protein